MGSKEDLTLIDTNIFVIDLRYKRDVNYHSNLAFLDTVAQTCLIFWNFAAFSLSISTKNSYLISGVIFKSDTR